MVQLQPVRTEAMTHGSDDVVVMWRKCCRLGSLVGWQAFQGKPLRLAMPAQPPANKDTSCSNKQMRTSAAERKRRKRK